MKQENKIEKRGINKKNNNVEAFTKINCFQEEKRNRSKYVEAIQNINLQFNVKLQKFINRTNEI